MFGQAPALGGLLEVFSSCSLPSRSARGNRVFTATASGISCTSCGSLPPGPPPSSAALFQRRGMCYNRRAVERTAKQQVTPVLPERTQFVPFVQPAEIVAHPAAAQEDASRYCPVCSQRLASRRCKLICSVCGYYMSCADYY